MRQRGINWWSRWQPRAAVIILSDGSALEAILVELGDYLVVKNASLIRENGQAAADGEILVHRSQVTSIQVLPTQTAEAPAAGAALA